MYITTIYCIKMNHQIKKNNAGALTFAIIWIILGAQIRNLYSSNSCKSYLNLYLSFLLDSIQPQPSPWSYEDHIRHEDIHPPCISSHLRTPSLRSMRIFYGCMGRYVLDMRRRSPIFTRQARSPFNYHCEGMMISTHYMHRWGAWEWCEHQCLIMAHFD